MIGEICFYLIFLDISIPNIQRVVFLRFFNFIPTRDLIQVIITPVRIKGLLLLNITISTDF